MLEAAIEFKNESILSRKTTVDGILSDSLDTSTDHAPPAPPLSKKLKVLSHEEVCELLEQCFRKVVELRVGEGAGQQARQELEVRLEEESEGRRRVESLLGQVQLEGERALLAHQLVSGSRTESRVGLNINLACSDQPPPHPNPGP